MTNFKDGRIFCPNARFVDMFIIGDSTVRYDVMFLEVFSTRDLSARRFFIVVLNYCVSCVKKNHKWYLINVGRRRLLLTFLSATQIVRIANKFRPFTDAFDTYKSLNKLICRCKFHPKTLFKTFYYQFGSSFNICIL